MDGSTTTRETDEKVTNTLLDALCDHFDLELHRQRAVLKACCIQSEASRRHDVGSLESATEELSQLMAEALVSERERLLLLRELVSVLGLSEASEQTLTRLIECVPDPWKSRMRDFQAQIRETLAATRDVVRGSAGYMRRAGRVVDGCIEHVIGKPKDREDAYDCEGRAPNGSMPAPALINTAG